jgi:lactobin A/cerein 7B family class IIb bacteriocin
MSVMSHSDFDNNIQALDAAEIEQVDGGVLPLLAIAYVGIGLSTGTLIVGAGVLVGLELSRD